MQFIKKIADVVGKLRETEGIFFTLKLVRYKYVFTILYFFMYKISFVDTNQLMFKIIVAQVYKNLFCFKDFVNPFEYKLILLGYLDVLLHI